MDEPEHASEPILINLLRRGWLCKVNLAIIQCVRFPLDTKREISFCFWSRHPFKELNNFDCFFFRKLIIQIVGSINARVQQVTSNILRSTRRGNNVDLGTRDTRLGFIPVTS
ncbi:hypothetical protein D3C73_1334990 [compost metagenome]